MIPFEISIQGERDITIRLQRLPDTIRRRLRDAMEDFLPRLAAAQRARAPRGRTGRLASQIGQIFIDEGDDFIRGRVTVVAPTGWQYGKAGALEYGAPGRRARFTVREHKRRGRGIGMETLVDRYQRTQRLVALRFIRGPFDAMRAEIEADLRAAVEAAVQEVDAAT